MSRHAAFRLLLAGMALAYASDAHAGADGRSSSLIPVWDLDETPRNFILDSSRLDSRILDTLAARLGARAFSRDETGYCYERRSFGRAVYGYCFRAEWTPATLDTWVADTNAWSIDTIRLRKGRLFGYYTFESWGSSGWRRHNLSAFLHSAYHQDLYPGYRGRDSLFRPMPSQNQPGLWLRGALSPIWAARYVSKGEPFTGLSSHGDFEKLAYLLDGGFTTLAMLNVVMILVAGQAEARTRMLWVLGGAHTALSLGGFLPILSMDLGESIRFRASGYRFRVPCGTIFLKAAAGPRATGP